MKLLEEIQALEFPAQLPEMLLAVHKRFDAPKVDDVAAAAAQALQNSGIMARMKAGDSVAVGVGSRGIANLPVIVRSVVDRLKASGMQPYVVPAMGSHGGATALGQIEMLAQLGVTEASIGVRIEATMELKRSAHTRRAAAVPGRGLDGSGPHGACEPDRRTPISAATWRAAHPRCA